MATFAKHGNGVQARVRRTGYAEQSRTFSKGTPTKKRRDAEAWARSIESEMDRGVFVSRAEAESTTLGEALKRYKREVTPRKKGATVEEYRINALIEHSLAKRTLAGIRGAEIAKFRDEELARLAPSTVVKTLALISHLFEMARKEWGIEVDNPVRKISKPKVDNARERRPSPDEWAYLLAALDDPGDAVKTKERDRRNEWSPKIARFAVETAMRQGEILALEWKHVDLTRSVATLPITKNGTSRDVPLSSAAVALLKGCEGAVAKLRRGRVFPTTASALKQSFTRAVARARRNYLADQQKAGTEPLDDFLVDLHFHDLRHEATSRLANVFQMHELMKVTGHKDPRMLARYYHPKAEDLAKKLA